MAGIKLRAVSPAITTATALLSLVKAFAPTNQRLKILGYKVSFNGTTAANEPVKVELYRISTAGTFTTLTPVKLEPGVAEVVQSVCGHTATVEPTKTDILDRVYVHPQGGYEVLFPEGQEPLIAGATGCAVVVTPANAVSVAAEIIYEE